MLPKLLLHGSTSAALAGLFWSYSILPTKVAIHFGASGKADAWASKTSYLLMGIFVLALIWALFAFLPSLIDKLPKETLNIPNRDHWLMPEHIDEFRTIFRDYMFVYGGITQLFLLSIGILVHQAQTQQAQLSVTATGILLAIFLLATFSWIIAMIRRFSI